MQKQAKNELLTSLRQQSNAINEQIATLEREIMLQDIAKKCDFSDFLRQNRNDPNTLDISESDTTNEMLVTIDLIKRGYKIEPK